MENPFGYGRRELKATPGSTLLELIEEVGLKAKGKLRVLLDGDIVEQEQWPLVRPEAGAMVLIRRVPELGIVEAIFIAVAVVVAEAVTAAAIAIGFSVGVGVTIGGIVGILAGAAVIGGIGYGLYTAYTAIAKPQNPRLGDGATAQTRADSSTSPGSNSPTINGARNAARPWSPVWNVFGKHRITPPLSAKTFTEIVGGQMYLRMLLHCGYGPLDISAIKIGETDIDEFSGVEYEVREGWDDDAPFTLYVGSIATEDANVLLHNSKGQATGSHVRTTATETDEISVDFSLPGGFEVFDDKGEKERRRIQVQVRIRPTGTSNWLVPAPGSYTVNGASAATSGFRLTSPDKGRKLIGYRLVLKKAGFVRGQYDVEVRCTRASGTAGGPNATELYWVGLTSINTDPPIVGKGWAGIALRIKASDQLSGQVDTLNCVAQRYIRKYDDTEGRWLGEDAQGNQAKSEYVLSRSPAWAFAEILRGRANPDPVSDAHIDHERLLFWDALCTVNGWTCDVVVDFYDTVYEIASDVALTGRATPHLRDGKFSVAIEYDRSADAPVSMLTPRNTIAGTYHGTKTAVVLPHAIRSRFISEILGWVQDEVIYYAPGFDATTAQDYQELELWGITDANRAWKEAEFKFRQASLRPETHTVGVDIEYLSFERGDIILFAHDVPLLGQAYGRTQFATTTEITLDEQVEQVFGTAYGVVVRQSDGTIVKAQVVNDAVEGEVHKTKTLTLTTPLVPGDVPGVDSLVTYGVHTIETRRMMVLAITPKPDLTAVIDMVDEAPEVFDSGIVPPYDPGITPTPNAAPFAPVIEGIDVGPSALILNVRAARGGPIPPTHFEWQFRRSNPDGNWNSNPLVPAGGIVAIRVEPVLEGEYYDIRVRAVGGAIPVTSEWVLREDVIFEGGIVAADSFRVTGLQVKGKGSSTVFEEDDVELSWRLNNRDAGLDSILDPNAHALQGVDRGNPFFQDYQIEVYDPSELVNPIRIDHVFTRSYFYTSAKQQLDGGPRDRVTFAVSFRDKFGNLGEKAWITVTNPAPRAPLSVDVGISTGTIWAVPHGVTDNDLVGYVMIAVRKADHPSGIFTPKDEYIVADSATTDVVWRSAPADDYWVQVAGYDSFGKKAPRLNWSAVHAATVTTKGVNKDVIASGHKVLSAVNSPTPALTVWPDPLWADNVFLNLEVEILGDVATSSAAGDAQVIVGNSSDTIFVAKVWDNLPADDSEPPRTLDASSTANVLVVTPDPGWDAAVWVGATMYYMAAGGNQFLTRVVIASTSNSITLDSSLPSLPIAGDQVLVRLGGEDTIRVVASDLADGVLNALKVGDLTVDTLHLRRGAITNSALITADDEWAPWESGDRGNVSTSAYYLWGRPAVALMVDTEASGAGRQRAQAYGDVPPNTPWGAMRLHMLHELTRGIVAAKGAERLVLGLEGDAASWIGDGNGTPILSDNTNMSFVSQGLQSLKLEAANAEKTGAYRSTVPWITSYLKEISVDIYVPAGVTWLSAAEGVEVILWGTDPPGGSWAVYKFGTNDLTPGQMNTVRIRYAHWQHPSWYYPDSPTTPSAQAGFGGQVRAIGVRINAASGLEQAGAHIYVDWVRRASRNSALAVAIADVSWTPGTMACEPGEDIIRQMILRPGAGREFVDPSPNTIIRGIVSHDEDQVYFGEFRNPWPDMGNVWTYPWDAFSYIIDTVADLPQAGDEFSLVTMVDKFLKYNQVLTSIINLWGDTDFNRFAFLSPDSAQNIRWYVTGDFSLSGIIFGLNSLHLRKRFLNVEEFKR